MEQTSALTQDQVKEFVFAAHGDLEKVRRLLAEEPALLDACYLELNERPIEAAGHTGNRPIAEFLLGQGAPLNIFCAAMLGEVERVREFLVADPALANANGVHGISLLAHVAMSGRLEMVGLLESYGNHQDPSHALHGALAFGHMDIARWLLQQGADPQVRNWQGKSPLGVAEEQGDEAMILLLREYGATE
jgi:ankyrin repeat protein